MLDSGCGDEAVETGVLVGDAGDESVQRGDVENVGRVVGQCSLGDGGGEAVELGARGGEEVERVDWAVLAKFVGCWEGAGEGDLPIAPHSMRDSDMLRPIPRAPPVTTMTFPAG